MKKQTKNKIEFDNRYPNVWSKIIRNKKDKNLWEYQTNSKLMRHSWDEKTKELVMVDPEGGPALCVGCKIGKMDLIRIFRDGLKIMFELREVKHEKKN